MNRVEKELQKMREIVESMKLPQDNEIVRLTNLKPITPEDIKNHARAWQKITKGEVE